MKWMGWAPRDLGYRAAMPGHITAVLDLMDEEAAEIERRRGES